MHAGLIPKQSPIMTSGRAGRSVATEHGSHVPIAYIGLDSSNEVAELRRLIANCNAIVICVVVPWTSGYDVTRIAVFWKDVLNQETLGGREYTAKNRCAVIWEPSTCDVLVQQLPATVESDTTIAFRADIHFAATERDNSYTQSFFCVACSCAKPRAFKCVANVLEYADTRTPFLMGGSFHVLPNLMACYLDDIVKKGTIRTRPLLFEAKGNWPDVYCCVSLHGTIDLEGGDPEDHTGPQSVCQEKTSTPSMVAAHIKMRTPGQCNMGKRRMDKATEPSSGGDLSHAQSSKPAREKRPMDVPPIKKRRAETATEPSRPVSPCSVNENLTSMLSDSDPDQSYSDPESDATEDEDDRSQADNPEIEGIVALLVLLCAWSYPAEDMVDLESIARDVLDETSDLTDAVAIEIAVISDTAFYDKQHLNKDTEIMRQEMMACDRIYKAHLSGSAPSSELGCDAVAECRRSRVVEFMLTELTNEQQKSKRWQLVKRDGRVIPTHNQTNSVDSILRSRLGSKFVANAIFQTGLPEAMTDSVSEYHLMSDVLAWLMRIGSEIDERRADPLHSALQRHSSDPAGLPSDLQQRKRTFALLGRQLKRGKKLQRWMDEAHCEEGFYRSLSVSDKVCLDDFESGFIRKRRERLRVARPHAFRLAAQRGPVGYQFEFTPSAVNPQSVA